MEPTQSVSTLPELFYDLLGIFVPGLYLLVATFFVHKPIVRELLAEPLIHPAVTGLILAYLFGYLLYSISSLIVAKPFSAVLGQPTHFLLPGASTDKYLRRHRLLFLGVPPMADLLATRVAKGIQQLHDDFDFRISQANIDIVYELCRNYVMERSARRAIAIRKEQTYGEMSRAVVLISILALSALIIAHNVPSVVVEHFWPQLVVHFVFLVAFAFKYAQARIVGPLFIYVTFSVMVADRTRYSI